jgi:1-deoxy-D-xylulose-5-phosphate reductoisomerase
VAAQRPCTVMVMSAVPVQAAGRIRPDPASSTGVVDVVVAVDRPPDVDGVADADDGSPDGEGEVGSPADGAGDSDDWPDDAGLCPVIWMSPTTTSTEASSATTRIPITQRVLVTERAAIPPVCAPAVGRRDGRVPIAMCGTVTILGAPSGDNGRVTESARAPSAEPGHRSASSSTECRRVVLLGSTGSIGTQALEVIAAHPDRFEVVGLAAGGSNPDLFADQAAAHPAAALASATPVPAADVRAIIGPRAATELVESVDADVVLNGITGSIGLEPTLAALRAGRTLALANKESLVAGGPLVTAAATPGQIVPVDSEHSALAQCLRGGTPNEVARLVVTASGGPFRGWTRQQVEDVTAEQALAHPTWSMGPVVTINSATLVNKGLEVIEAHLLFGIPFERIDVVVHPQSVIHSMVTFVDGSTIAQASPPDMKLPIALALAWPDRLNPVSIACDFADPTAWTFEPVDREVFPALDLAYAAGRAGGTVPAAFNAANEEAVAAFRAGRVHFTGISDLLGGILDEADHARSNPRDVQDVWATEEWARRRAREIIARSTVRVAIGPASVGAQH